jgi:hypothetical protein
MTLTWIVVIAGAVLFVLVKLGRRIGGADAPTDHRHIDTAGVGQGFCFHSHRLRGDQLVRWLIQSRGRRDVRFWQKTDFID